MKILGIEHVAIATHSLEEFAPFWRDILGIRNRRREILESEGVTIDIYDTGNGKIEFLTEYGENSTITKFLAKKDTTIHHLCLEVDDITDAVKEFRQKGIRIVNEDPQRGAEGYSVVFIHPESTGGVLVELCQKSRII